MVGVHADTTSELGAGWGGGDGTETEVAARSWTTGSLPYDWMAGEVDVYDEDLAQDGWVLANVVTGVSGPALAVMLDRTGQPVWYHEHPGGDGQADLEPSWLGDGRLLVGPAVPGGEPVVEVDLQGRVHWQGPVQPAGEEEDINLPWSVVEGGMPHKLERLENGDFLTFRFERDGDVVGDRIERFDAEGEVVWSWSAFEHLEVNPGELFLGQDWTHFNSAVVEDDALYVNSWNLGRIYRVDLADGAVDWTLGPDGDFAPDPDAATPWFGGAHSLERLENGRFLLYDNGLMDRGWSRVVEYEVDQDTLETRITWEYPGELAEDDWYNFAWGDVDPLADGSVLISAGAGPLGMGSSPSRLVEVTREGEMAWQMWWANDDVSAGSYHAEWMPALAVPAPSSAR